MHVDFEVPRSSDDPSKRVVEECLALSSTKEMLKPVQVQLWDALVSIRRERTRNSGV